MQVKSKWREFEVSAVHGLPEAWIVDEPNRRIMVRRSYLRPWSMLWALVNAMNEASLRDKNWARNIEGKGGLSGGDTVVLFRKKWRVVPCSIVGDESPDKESIVLRPVRVDHEKQEIQVCSRFSLAFGATALVEAVADVCRDAACEAVEDVVDSVMTRLSESTTDKEQPAESKAA